MSPNSSKLSVDDVEAYCLAQQSTPTPILFRLYRLLRVDAPDLYCSLLFDVVKDREF